MPITEQLLDELLKEYEQPEDLLGDDGLLHQLTKDLVERALEGEITHHLGYKKHDSVGDHTGNSGNGTTPKTIKGKRGQTSMLKSRQVEAEGAEKEAVLNRLWEFYQFGSIDLYFGDESAFSMNPKLPYGWSPKGERIKIFPLLV